MTLNDRSLRFCTKTEEICLLLAEFDAASVTDSVPTSWGNAEDFLLETLRDWSTFTLVDDTYLRLYRVPSRNNTQSFCLLRVARQDAVVVIQLAFLDGHYSERRALVEKLKKRLFSARRSRHTPPAFLRMGTSASPIPYTISDLPMINEEMHSTSAGAEVSSGSENEDELPEFFSSSNARGTANDIQAEVLPSPLRSMDRSLPWLLVRYPRVPSDFAQFGVDQKSDRGASIRVISYLNQLRLFYDVKTLCNGYADEARQIIGHLIRFRLEEGFVIATTNAGIVNLVKEIPMVVHKSEGSEKPSVRSCLVQYVLFPVFNVEYIAIELWVEPQSGKAMPGREVPSHLHNCTYEQFFAAIHQKDLSFIASLNTFDNLNSLVNSTAAIPRANVSTKRSIAHRPMENIMEIDDVRGGAKVQIIPFTMDVSRLLLTSFHNDVIYSGISRPASSENQDGGPMLPRVASSGGTEINLSTVLLQTMLAAIARFSDMEVNLSPNDLVAISKTLTGQSEVFVPHRCFIRNADKDSFILTFIADPERAPAFSDVFDTPDASAPGKQEEKGGDDHRNPLLNFESVRVHVFECSKAQVVASGSLQPGQQRKAVYDMRSESLERLLMSGSRRSSLLHKYLMDLNFAFARSFVQTVFYGLQFKAEVPQDDFTRAVEICSVSEHEIDISALLRDLKLHESDEVAPGLPMPILRHDIKRRFGLIVGQNFSQVSRNSNYFFYLENL